MAVDVIPPRFTGTFTGITLVEDEETGMLTAPEKPMHFGQLRFGNGTGPLSLFDVSKKLNFINYLYDCWPNLPLAARKVGINYETVKNHLKIDEMFAKCVDAVKDRVIGDVHQVRMDVARTKPGSFDRMCVLNAHMPELYNPKTKIEVSHTMEPMEARRREAMLSKVVDAEIVETVKRVRKAQRP
jgi:hypothetical protein